MSVFFRDDFESADMDKWYQNPLDVQTYGTLADHIVNGQVKVGDPVYGASFVAIIYKTAGMPDFPTGDSPVIFSTKATLHRPDTTYHEDGGETSALLALGGFGQFSAGFFLQSSYDVLSYSLWCATINDSIFLGSYPSGAAPTDIELTLKIAVDSVNITMYLNEEIVYSGAHGFTSWDDFCADVIPGLDNTGLYDQGNILQQIDVQSITPNTLSIDWFQIEAPEPTTPFIHADFTAFPTIGKI